MQRTLRSFCRFGWAGRLGVFQGEESDAQIRCCRLVGDDAFAGRGAVRLRSSSALERFACSKLFFDPSGLIIAESDGQIVGFAHAGFGATSDRKALDLQQEVQKVLQMIPEKYRTVLTLRDLENFSTSEIAAVLHRKEATIRWRLAEARHRFQYYWGKRHGTVLPENFTPSESPESEK